MKCRNTKVFIRVLPNIKNCWEDIKILENRKKMYIRSLQEFSLNGAAENTSTAYWQFDCDRIFYNESQFEIYQIITEDIIKRAFFSGTNSMILAYGQTGTGKSLTISGLNASFQDRGILPRMISDIFTQREILKNTNRINVEISYIETRRNYLKDLCVVDGPYLEYNTIKNVTKTKVLTEDEALRFFFLADGRRAVAANSNNSHISNSVFTFYITSNSKSVQEKNLISKIHVVDLMGADRYGYETCYLKSAYDVSTGNLSKSQMEQFFNVLSENIPEKTAVFEHLNILIYFLRDTLTTDSILRFVGHIRTHRDELIISLSMLRFAQILRGIKSKILKVHVNVNEDVVLKNIKEDFKLLKKELELNSMLNNENLKVNITQERIEHMESVADDYLRDKTNELLVLNVCDATTAMKVFKHLYNKLQIERDQLAATTDRLRRAQEDSNRTASKRGADGATGGHASKTIGSARGGSIKSINSYDASSIKRARNYKRSASKGFSAFDAKTDQSSTGAGATATKADGGKASRTLHKSGSGDPRAPSRHRSSQLSDVVGKAHQDAAAVSQEAVLQKADDALPPRVVPSFGDAWAAFVASDAAHGALHDRLQLHRASALDANRLYMAQVRLLTDCKQAADARRNDLLKAQMQTELETGFRQTSKQDQQSEATSPLEGKYEELLKQVELQFLTQQEVVLKYQTELNLYIQQYKASKFEINDRFNAYCKESYKTVVPPLPEAELDMELKLRSLEEIEGEYLQDFRKTETDLETNTDEMLNKYEHLKQLRDRECDQRRIRLLKNKKWVRSCKA